MDEQLPSFCRIYQKGNVRGITLQVRVQPRCSKQGPLDILGEQLKWGVHQAPQDSAANKELCQSLASFFKVPKSTVEILQGETSRSKVVLIQGASTVTIQEALQALRGRQLLP